MFEDDIEVHSGYFDYVLTCLHKHVFTGPRGERSKGYHANHLFGIALTTPRYDETSIPRKVWRPDMEIGVSEPFFLFQLACSWGALYFPWTWRRYLSYYKWRKQLELPKKIDVIPFSYVNIWERSWKRYLQELMFITGGVMLYPNFANQTSLSTHHREIGEHTQGQGMEPLVDALGTNNKPIFTVPLLGNTTINLSQVLQDMKGLTELPVVNFYHNRTADLYSVRELGYWSADMLREFGLDLAAFNRNPTCVLDYANPLRFPRQQKQQYMTFLPQGNILEQMEQLRNAVAIAHSLSRTLILPDFIKDDDVKVATEEVVDVSLPKPFMVTRKKVKMAPKRLIAFHSFDSQGRLPPEPKNMPTENGEVRHIHLPLSHGTDHDIQRWFSGCKDDILLFTNLKNSFSQYVDLDENALFEDILADGIRLSPRLHESVEKMQEKMGGKYVCVEFYEPDESVCRRPKYEQKYWRTLFTRNCNSTLTKTMQYGYAWTRHIPELVDTESMYVVVRSGSSSSGRMPISMKTEKGDLLGVFSRGRDLNDTDRFTMPLVEEEVCAKASFFLGNAYSPFTKRVVARRARGRLLTAITGMGVVVPYRNETVSADCIGC
jgi:hypothetical protein